MRNRILYAAASGYPAIGENPDQICSCRGERVSGDTRQMLTSSLFEEGDRLFAPHARKIVEELCDGFAAFEIVEESLRGIACSHEDRRAADYLGVGMRDLIRAHRTLTSYRVPDVITYAESSVVGQFLRRVVLGFVRHLFHGSTQPSRSAFWNCLV